MLSKSTKFLLLISALLSLCSCSTTNTNLDTALAEKPSKVELRVHNDYQEILINNFDIKPVEESFEELNLWEHAIYHMNFTIPKHSKNKKYIKSITKNKKLLYKQLKAGHLFLFHIINELRARNMPLELAIIPIIESNFNPHATSPTGAKGLWQFTRGTGRYFKLYDDNNYALRKDTIASTNAALKYFDYLYNRFNDWSLAIAAYNVGEGTVDKAIRRNKARGLPTDLWHLRIPRVGIAYVDKLYAYMDILRNADEYNIKLPDMPYRPVFRRVKLKGRNLHELSRDIGVSTDRLKKLNPGFRNEQVRSNNIKYVNIPINDNDIISNYVIRHKQEQANNQLD